MKHTPSETRKTAGAMKAADWVQRYAEGVRLHPPSLETLAAIIDQKTAASEMLEALESLQAWAEYMGGWEAEAWSKAKAAIRKAKGDA